MLAGTLTTWRVLGWPVTQWRKKAWSRIPVSALNLISHHACQMGQSHRPSFILKVEQFFVDIRNPPFLPDQEVFVCPGTYTWSLAIPTYHHPWPSHSPTAYIPHHPGMKCDQMEKGRNSLMGSFLTSLFRRMLTHTPNPDPNKHGIYMDVNRWKFNICNGSEK